MVQGIGYRPFVAEKAVQFGLRGRVINAGGLVVVTATATEEALASFTSFLQDNYPDGCVIIDISHVEVKYVDFQFFSIEESVYELQKGWIPQIPPDIPVCDRCAAEMRDSSNRRYRYPFISCASCGPRYSIMDKLPYDRCNTAMDDFLMCESCKKEYTQKGGIRRHAQTISCKDCGPQLHFNNAGEKGEGRIGESGFDEGTGLLKRGGIVAVKDIGGYHLACLPWNADAVSELRRMKDREKKPFAVMFPNVDEIRKYCQVSDMEEKILKSIARPIVLLKKKEQASAMDQGVCGNSPYIGAMIPCNPLQIMLMEECGPLIMTSANSSGMPIIISDEEMNDWLKTKPVSCGSGILWNERDIRIPLDDSVIKIVAGRQQVFRRARGMVPLPIKLNANATEQIFAAGGDLKACFCFAGDGVAYLSQYLGDIEEEGAERLYRYNYRRIKSLFGFKPEKFAADAHPLYRSAKIAEQIAEGTEVIRLQHHRCHAASVIAEHGLEGSIIGVAFDGTGYGDDGTIWGSEIFLCGDDKDYKRIAHLKPLKLIGGNEGARNCQTMLCAYMDQAGIHGDDETAKTVAAALKNDINTVTSTSMGRLFDAVSALLGVCRYNDYEGEAPIELENEAMKSEEPYPLNFEIEDDGESIIGNPLPLIYNIVEARSKGAVVCDLAMGFHMAVADFVAETCRRLRKRDDSFDQVVLSGGTFQNRILLERVVELLEADGFSVYFNESVPPGDGGICLGQVYLCV